MSTFMPRAVSPAVTIRHAAGIVQRCVRPPACTPLILPSYINTLVLRMWENVLLLLARGDKPCVLTVS